jgi:hypothetical protein
MADYLYLFRGGMDMKNATADERNANMQKWMNWMKDLGQKGHFKGGEPLDADGKVLRGQKRVMTDGPYAEAKDIVGGYLIVSAKDLPEAAELAKGCPIFDHDGSVEVRTLLKM